LQTPLNDSDDHDKKSVSDGFDGTKSVNPPQSATIDLENQEEMLLQKSFGQPGNSQLLGAMEGKSFENMMRSQSRNSMSDRKTSPLKANFIKVMDEDPEVLPNGKIKPRWQEHRSKS